jgi:hypothetical protein
MGRASREKLQRRQQRASQQALVDRVQRSLPDEQLKITKRRTGRKVSEILMEFAKPWLDAVHEYDQRRAVIGMAVLAWNMAALPESELRDGKDPELAEKLGESGMAILKEMIARKLALYPEETRHLLDYQITGGGDDMRVDVIYSLLPEEIADLEPGDRKPGSAI